MKILYFLLTVVIATAPHVLSESKECKVQKRILKEIIDSVISVSLKMNVSQLFVENVITSKHCTYVNFCKAAMILSANTAEELRLNETGWRLPRQLVAYSRNVTCNINPSPSDQVPVHQFLENIKLCAQSHYRKPCNQMKLSWHS